MELLKRNIHLVRRATFGVHWHDMEMLQTIPTKDLLRNIMNTSSLPTLLLEAINDDDTDTPADIRTMNKDQITKEKMAANRSDLLALNLAWLYKMSTDNLQFAERVTFFWHNHFACRIRFAPLAQSLNNDIRINALGKFGDLLMAVAKSPAMILFLNNQQNRKAHPNENFARELLELFTLGRGFYKEQDVKEAARAFTGWGFKRRAGAFEFRLQQHDDGEKIFLNHHGNFGGEEIIQLLLKEYQTAKHVTKKIVNHFVSENIDDKLVDKLARQFFDTDYDIKKLLQTIFESEWFYHDNILAQNIKSPVELITGINRMFAPDYTNDKYLLRLQQALGQVVFFPPNVGGWPGGRAWIDSSSLLFRLKAGAAILNNGSFDFDEKDDMDDELFMMKKNKKNYGFSRATVDWNKILPAFEKIVDENLLQILVLGKPLTPTTAAHIPQFAKAGHKDYLLALLSLPEYQLV